MTASAPTVEQLARDALRHPDPIEALRALAALRIELTELERDLAVSAAGAGRTWTEIAQALGISKQAAHRRHRLAVKAAIDGGEFGAGGKMLVTAEARRCVQLAREEARLLGHQAVGTEHLLLGVLRCDRSHAARALRTLNVTLKLAREMLTATAEVKRGPQRIAMGDGSGVKPQARKVLEGSLRQAVKRREGYIGVEHLLLSLIAESRNGAVQTLLRLGVTPAELKAQIEREWMKTAGQATQVMPSLAQAEI
ncbi:MAG: hypothetical protein JO304_19930 [Solirubrobacterales bacterium]|nr:hypothetical protein [Solirubrobacterales bacterium]